jgi:hypothetical protein
MKRSFRRNLSETRSSGTATGVVWYGGAKRSRPTTCLGNQLAALRPQVLGTPQCARREFGMVSDNIDKATQQGATHIPTAYLYPVTAAAFHSIVRIAVVCDLQDKTDMARAPAFDEGPCAA